MLIHSIRIRVSLVYFPHRRTWSEWCDCHRTFSAQVLADKNSLPVNQKGKFLGFVLHVYRIFFGFEQFILPNDWLLAWILLELKFKWNRFELQMNQHESLSCLFELHKKFCFLFESICKTRLTIKTNIQVRKVPLEHYHTWMNHEIKMMNLNCTELLWDENFLLLGHASSVSDLLIGLKRMRSDLFSRQ